MRTALVMPKAVIGSCMKPFVCIRSGTSTIHMRRHHSTVREACELAAYLNVPNLILYHTEDDNIERRKALYTAEGRLYYKGNLYVPDDLECIELDKEE